MLRNSMSAIGLGLLASPLLIAGQVVSASAQTAPTVTFSASPTSIPNGQSSTLTWTSANATACSGTGKGFSPSGPSGSVAVSPGVTTTYGVTCTGAGGSASQSVAVAVTAAAQFTVGMTVAATGTNANPGTTYVWSTPTPNVSAIGSEASGNEGVVIGGPVSNSSTWWQVAFDDDLTGWTSQAGLALASPKAPTLSFSANPPSVASGASSTLTWSSTNATSCSGTGFSPSGVSGISLSLADVSHDLQHHLHRQRRIDDSISGGGREPNAQLHLESVASGHFQLDGDCSVRRHGDARPRLHGREPVRRDRRLDGPESRECRGQRRAGRAARFSDRKLGPGPELPRGDDQESWRRGFSGGRQMGMAHFDHDTTRMRSRRSTSSWPASGTSTSPDWRSRRRQSRPALWERRGRG